MPMITKVTAHVVRNSCAKIYRLNCMFCPLTLRRLDNTSIIVNAKTLIVSAHGFNGLMGKGRSYKRGNGQPCLTGVEQLCFIVCLNRVRKHSKI